MDNIKKNTGKRSHVLGILGTIAIHLLLFLFLILYSFITPIPPFPDDTGGGSGMGIEVNLGNSDEGIGSIQKDEIAMPDFKEVKTTQATLKENLLTQEADQNQAINNTVKEENKNNTEPVVNENALYKKNTNTTTNGNNQGITGNPGDQGNPNGNLYSNNYTGDGGNGDGKGHGTGPGEGDGKGPGVNYNLKGRTTTLLTKPEYTKLVAGDVVVEVTVDKYGKVVNAVPGVKGTTTTDKTLWSAAKKAALATKFSTKIDGPEEQKGTITYNFVLQ